MIFAFVAMGIAVILVWLYFRSLITLDILNQVFDGMIDEVMNENNTDLSFIDEALEEVAASQVKMTLCVWKSPYDLLPNHFKAFIK